MKVVILAGGLGSRLGEETDLRPKPMVEVGGMPLLLHVMKIYSAQGYNDFIICLGHLGYVIKEYFSNYELHRSDVVYDFKARTVSYFNPVLDDWRVTLIDTGSDTMTGGRLKRLKSLLVGEPFLMTYGDGVANVDIKALTAFHRSHGKLATVTAVQPPGRFGVLEVRADGMVSAFREKPADEIGWINGGFFVLEPKVLELIKDDQTVWEREPMEQLASRGELAAFRHRGFWQPIDTLRDRRMLEALWATNDPPWRIWPSNGSS